MRRRGFAEERGQFREVSRVEALAAEEQHLVLEQRGAYRRDRLIAEPRLQSDPAHFRSDDGRDRRDVQDGHGPRLPRQTWPVIGPSPEATVERVQLDDASWVDVSRGWLSGADELFDALLREVDWKSSQLFRYEKWIEERRLGSFWARGRPLPHPALAPVHKALERTYGATFNGFGMIQYRDASDGQAFHRDTDMRWLDDTVIAIVSLGARRPWLLRPRSARHTLEPGKGATHDLSPGSGDLIVMGGACQRGWEHSVPYLNTLGVGVRISLQWRFARKVGRPFEGAGFRAPLTYDRRV